MRILHVIGGLNRGGIETWLMHVLRAIDRDRFAFDFLVHATAPCPYDDEARELGARVLPCPSHLSPRSHARDFRRLLRKNGRYHAVHSHVHHFSGMVLRRAEIEGVPVRVAHSHNDTSTIDSAAGPFRHAYRRLMRRWIGRHATHGLAASRRAAASLFGAHWESDPRWRLLLYGLDLSPFREAPDRERVRRELGLPSRAFVVGHVGRFVHQKNHAFVVEVFREVARREPSAHLLLVGVGELRGAVERQVSLAGLSERVVFAGPRPDVPRLMAGAMDAFLFPSRFEGLGLVLVEAQAAGLPCITSREVPEEADVIAPLLRRLALDQPAQDWAEAVLDSRDRRTAPDRSSALAEVEASRFALRHCVEALERFYTSSHSQSDLNAPAGLAPVGGMAR